MVKPGPKPSGDYASKGATLSARITTETRKQLERSAKLSGLSISQEVEARLRRTFAEDKENADFRFFGGAQTYALMRLAAETIGRAERMTGARWFQDRFTFDLAVAAAHAFMMSFRPPGPGAPPAAFPIFPGVGQEWPEAQAAARAEFAKLPEREIAARVAAGVVALFQMAPYAEGPGPEAQYWREQFEAGAEWGAFRKAFADLGGRLTDPAVKILHDRKQRKPK